MLDASCPHLVYYEICIQRAVQRGSSGATRRPRSKSTRWIKACMESSKKTQNCIACRGAGARSCPRAVGSTAHCGSQLLQRQH